MFGIPGVGSMELMIVGVIALLLFGKNLPNARNVKSFAEFKKGISSSGGIPQSMMPKTITYTPSSTKSTVEDRPNLPKKKRQTTTISQHPSLMQG